MNEENDDFQARFESVLRIYGGEAKEKLLTKKILIIGLGGVGSWSFEALVRTGFHQLKIVDLDDICISNTNRQLHTHQESIGKFKVDELQNRALSINPHINIETTHQFYTEKTSDDILSYNPDYILDCIDSVKNKCHLISCAKEKNIPILVTGGAGGKKDPLQLQVNDLNRTFNDDLLMQTRKKLKREFGFPRYDKKKFHIPAIFSPETKIEPDNLANKNGLNCQNGIGSLLQVTGSMGFLAASICTNHLLDYAKN